jgi:hypothetical protein
MRRRLVRGSGERGSAAIELLGALPVVVIVVLCVLQAVAFAYTANAADQAVRDGARARSLGEAVGPAVERSLPGRLTASSVTYPAGGVRIEVKVPKIAIFPTMKVTREAVFPRTVP